MNDSEQKMVDSGNSGSLVMDKIMRKSNMDNPAESAYVSELSDDNGKNNLEVILDIPLDITIELGRTRMVINDLLKLAQGAVIELSKPAGETLEVLANQRLVAKGEVVVVNDKYGIRLTEIVSPMERLESLK
ncbi:flagellar motor switch protein FliN/FliY [Desulfosarcina sp. BuS5]|uniref:flagellar motor switch protein FliN n=1 Tax=Desulfosarcina sp. BuS5 TaxID=933262 RepID=UPI0009FEC6AE|nr:flagellar motor switch protein FliN [Desulfosarcina sp. BuS5]WDN90038.1 flagellar motor switch protein FliN/FliY [Desulfosarcina sp. BuS5]